MTEDQETKSDQSKESQRASSADEVNSVPTPPKNVSLIKSLDGKGDSFRNRRIEGTSNGQG